jgi:hypothetical protein
VFAAGNFVDYSSSGQCTPDFEEHPDDADASPNNPCHKGMPAWQVSEPYIGLWIMDQPLGYQPAIGPLVSLDLAFKQRGTPEGANTNIFSFGKRWTCSWLSYLVKQAGEESDTNYWFRTAGQSLGGYASGVEGSSGGGQSTGGGTGGRKTIGIAAVFPLRPEPSDIDYSSNSRMSGDKTNGFTLLYPDGSKDFYGFIVTNSSGKLRNAFLSERWNAIGQKIRLDYDSYIPGDDPVIRLKYVVDGDNKTNSIYYVATNDFSPNLISHVVDPFGRTNFLKYDNQGRMTNIIDVAGLSSS